MPSSRRIFLLGPGYIGAELLNLLSIQECYNIVTMVRRPEAAAEFKSLGVEVILATLD
jgi:uncharacterized protein YbjT (DUF2867 family)